MTPPPQTILVIGGGLGGLAFAQILRHSSVADKYKVVIYERDATATDRAQGYQIGINRSGLSYLSPIPHIASVLDMEEKENAISVTDGDLNVMLQLKHVPVGQDAMAGMVNRWKLRQALAEGLNVEWGKKFVRYEETEKGVTAHFEDGTCASGDFLIGADGAKSRVRAQRCPELRLEELPVLSVAGSFDVTPDIRAMLPKVVQLVETAFLVRAVAVGGNTVIMMLYDAPEGGKRLLWSYSFPAASAPNLPNEAESLKKVIDARTSVFSPELASLILETSAEEFISFPRSPVSIIPMKGNPFGKSSRVTLLGDAAHAMTTHRGIGANTAFADASDLAHALICEDDFWTSLSDYEKLMIKRGFEAIKVSKQSTEMIHMVGIKSVVRNVIVRAVGWVLWGYRILFG